MELVKVLFAALLILHVLAVEGTTRTETSQNDFDGNENDLREMLSTVMEQNRKLVLQNRRLQQVWLGMREMCKALSMPTNDCHQTDGLFTNISNITDAKEKQTTSIPFRSTVPLKVLSIESTGSVSNVTKIGITYVVPSNHYISWIGPRNDGTTWRKGGKMIQNAPGSDIYTSTVAVEDLQSMKTLFFRLYNCKESISIEINTTAAAEKPQLQNVTAPSSSLIDVKPAFMAPKRSDLTITGVLKLNRTFIGDVSAVELFFAALNTSANPPIYFEKNSFISESISLNVSKRTKETSNFQITISYPVVKFGGFLTIHLPYIESSNDRMVHKFLTGPIIKVFAYGTKEVIPYNVVGLMPLKQQTLIYPPSRSIVCLAVGNPRPNATILKADGGGGFSKLTTETTSLDDYFNVEVLSLSASDLSNEGSYICRASNGNKTVESSTNVVVIKKAVIDDSKTGVMTNTSKLITISCKAKGYPRPELDFRLYDEDGPFMIRSGLYKYTNLTSGKYTSRVTMMLSPVDDVDVHTVFCFAAQFDSNRGVSTVRKISIFPEGKYNNWELYYRLHDVSVF